MSTLTQEINQAVHDLAAKKREQQKFVEMYKKSNSTTTKESGNNE